MSLTVPVDLDSLDLASPSPQQEKASLKPKAVGSAFRNVLYFDLETVPDYDRAALFDLDPIPEPAKRTELEQCPPAADVLKGTLDEFKATVNRLNPVNEFLGLVDALEKESKKPRKGVFDITAELRNQDAARESLIVAQRKQMSVTPEMCKIVAIGWSFNGDADCLVVDDEPAGITEQHILDAFWSLAKSAKSVCGFNILNFDLPVIFVRSILLDVAASRQFDTKPWGTDVIDLMAKRFPKSSAIGLKRLSKLMGIDVPAGDVDGSQVEQLWKTDRAKVGEYVLSDIKITRKIHEMYSGFFC